MQHVGALVGIGVGALAIAGAIGWAVLGGDDETGPASAPDTGTTTSTNTPGSTGISWSPDALLPDVAPSGAAQAEWAAATLRNLDVDGDGALRADDGAAGTSAWSHDTSHIVDALISRYDVGGDGFLDAGEAAGMGSDVAVDGWMTADATRRLREALGA
jgi:hypothetical protein